MEKNTDRPRINFCKEPSEMYLRMLDECGNDPRAVVGQRAINRMRVYGWQSSWDERRNTRIVDADLAERKY